MKQPADSLFGTGISFEKEKYFAIYSQDGTFYGKKVRDLEKVAVCGPRDVISKTFIFICDCIIFA